MGTPELLRRNQQQLAVNRLIDLGHQGRQVLIDVPRAEREHDPSAQLKRVALLAVAMEVLLEPAVKFPSVALDGDLALRNGNIEREPAPWDAAVLRLGRRIAVFDRGYQPRFRAD